MAIWDFSDYDLEELYAIQKNTIEMQRLGFEPDEDMYRELSAEIDEREFDLKDFDYVDSRRDSN